jgi:hypothetical protein
MQVVPQAPHPSVEEVALIGIHASQSNVSSNCGPVMELFFFYYFFNVGYRYLFLQNNMQVVLTAPPHPIGTQASQSNVSIVYLGAVYL